MPFNVPTSFKAAALLNPVAKVNAVPSALKLARYVYFPQTGLWYAADPVSCKIYSTSDFQNYTLVYTNVNTTDVWTGFTASSTVLCLSGYISGAAGPVTVTSNDGLTFTRTVLGGSGSTGIYSAYYDSINNRFYWSMNDGANNAFISYSQDGLSIINSSGAGNYGLGSFDNIGIFNNQFIGIGSLVGGTYHIFAGDSYSTMTDRGAISGTSIVTNLNRNKIAYGANCWVIASTSNAVYRSTDLVNFTNVYPSGMNNTVSCILFSETLQQFMLGSSNGQVIAYSPDGINWKPYYFYAPSTISMHHITETNEGMIIGTDGSNDWFCMGQLFS